MSRIFLDTNFLVYTCDDGEPLKRDRARGIWSGLLSSPDTPVISTQVLLEYYNTLTRKMRVNPPAAKIKIELLQPIETVILTPPLIHTAIDLHGSASLSFWDSLIVTAAQFAGCSELWTEDLQEGRKFGNLEIVNPFMRG